jgi:hypothetical protein
MACYFIIHHHGGRIEATGAEGQGTVFNIRLFKNPNHPSAAEENQDFLQKVLLNEALWEKLLMAA